MLLLNYLFFYNKSNSQEFGTESFFRASLFVTTGFHGLCVIIGANYSKDRIKYYNKSSVHKFNKLSDKQLEELHIHTGVNKPLVCENHFSHHLYVVVVNPTLSFVETSRILLESMQTMIEPSIILIPMSYHRLSCLEGHNFHYIKIKSCYWFRDKYSHLLIPIFQPVLGKDGLIVDIYPWKHNYETKLFIIDF